MTLSEDDIYELACLCALAVNLEEKAADVIAEVIMSYAANKGILIQ